MKRTRIKTTTTTTTTTIVEWREIPEFPGYRVSDQGEVQTAWKQAGRGKTEIGDTWKSLRPNRVGLGYARYGLQAGGKRLHPYGHCLVLAAFVGPRPEGMQVLHSNGDCTDNRLANLRYGTPAENGADRKLHGTSGAGAKNNQAKLTDAKVRRILARLKREQTQEAIAKVFRVAPSTIANIQHNRTWRHVAR